MRNQFKRVKGVLAAAALLGGCLLTANARADVPRIAKNADASTADTSAQLDRIERDRAWRIPSRIRRLLAKVLEELTVPIP